MGTQSDESKPFISSNEKNALCHNVNQSRTSQVHSVSTQNVGFTIRMDPWLLLMLLGLCDKLKEDVSERITTNEAFAEDKRANLLMKV
jgi:hypothetical protein